jgi:hypothetical protein
LSFNWTELISIQDWHFLHLWIDNIFECNLIKCFRWWVSTRNKAHCVKKTWGSRDARLGSSQLDQSKLEEIFKEWSSNETNDWRISFNCCLNYVHWWHIIYCNMTFTIIYFEFIDESTFDVKYKVNWLWFYHI